MQTNSKHINVSCYVLPARFSLYRLSSDKIRDTTVLKTESCTPLDTSTALKAHPYNDIEKNRLSTYHILLHSVENKQKHKQVRYNTADSLHLSTLPRRMD